MISEHKKRVILTLHELTVDMLDTISETVGLTKSEIVQQLLRDYSLNYWSDPERVNEIWKNWKERKNEKK